MWFETNRYHAVPLMVTLLTLHRVMEAGYSHEHMKFTNLPCGNFRFVFFNTEAKCACTTPLQTENLQTELTKRG